MIVGIGGYLRVDYTKLDVSMQTLEQWRAGKRVADLSTVG